MASTTLGEWLAQVTQLGEAETHELVANGSVEVNTEVVIEAELGLANDDVVRVSLSRAMVDKLSSGKDKASLEIMGTKTLDDISWPVVISLAYPNSAFVDFATNSLNAISLADGVEAFVYPDGVHAEGAIHGKDNHHVETCSVCMDDVHEIGHFEAPGDGALVRLAPCGWKHYFHRACITRWIECGTQKCPVCGAICGTLIGNMPGGTFRVSRYPPGDNPISGFESDGTIEISYSFPDGTQTEAHYHPGRPYYGTYRAAYLPDTPEGREVLGLLRLAFIRRHMFTVGTSVTTGCEDCVVWAGIHAKTNTYGGATSFGYPDETYFERVKAEMADRGIYPSDLAGVPEDEYFKAVELETV
ncbi:uncharacterized protein AMSG_01699 [Thecamonas trahens ATCC 50062]|uniref:RING-type E3 ubiquitin transferase n=1 Tax=Thecamonas trahens ATCC 50062 TaxID=461836 RepID=A0A0L0DS24_THETB|nr:hypothetical protein AMSG_01699 [Thecamonas trahens ATCC 50062]KNC54846.1 hypothetical protein AMSG_01699 [Thecamonas trahens ATCC 50062]|eukprot:XP_013761743.1 hypothetical protein AMSG_01699 [Thecamonas trahens ATCC 50062]